LKTDEVVLSWRPPSHQIQPRFISLSIHSKLRYIVI